MVRMIFYGGAKKASDNSSFYHASRNVIKDYKKDIPILEKFIDSAKTIIDTIKAQKVGTIQSIDFFCHSSQIGLHLVKSANLKTNILDKDMEIKKLNTSLYSMKFYESALGDYLHIEANVLNSMSFNRFTSSAKIELHGCNTADELYLFDNFAEELSELLYDAEKNNSVVIGHITKANPLINGDGKTTIAEQDYRHGGRNIYNNGDKLSTSYTKGRIGANEINLALKSR
jgi:hypothetical protein